jgi:hypothetical protein
MKYIEHKVFDDGWTDWIAPALDYKLACCDCGLIHQIEFKVHEDGTLTYRAKRDNRATAQRRRYKK